MHFRLIATWCGFFCMHARRKEADVAGLMSEEFPTAGCEVHSRFEFPRKSQTPLPSPSSLLVFYILIFVIGRHGEIRIND